MVSVVNASGNQDIDGILWGWKYSQTNITYSFPTSTSEYSSYAQVNGFQGFSAFQANAARQALNNIASFTNLTFTETTFGGRAAALRQGKFDRLHRQQLRRAKHRPAYHRHRRRESANRCLRLHSTFHARVCPGRHVVQSERLQQPDDRELPGCGRHHA